MKSKAIKTRPFATKRSLAKSSKAGESAQVWIIKSDGKSYRWSNRMERVDVIRKGVPYSYIEAVSERLNRPVKSVLSIVGIPQTTYNKKKIERSLLANRESELMVMLTELIDYGVVVFDQEEEKFQRWLTKPNISLGGESPVDMLDTATGIDEVNNCLHRIEYGNFA